MRFKPVCGFDLRAAAVFVTVLAAVLALSAGQALANHVSCGDVITQDTTLDSNLVCTASIGILIGADGITLDLNGHYVFAEDAEGFGTGLINQGHDDVTLENGTIAGGDTGISLSDVTNNHLHGVGGSADLYGLGLTLHNSHNNRVVNSSFDGGYRGFGTQLSGSDHNRIEQNALYGEIKALSLESSDANRVERNTVSAENVGIVVSGTNNVIERNSVQHVGGYRCACGQGILLSRSQGAVVRWNSVLDNQVGGIVLSDSADTLLANNIASDNGRGDFGTTYKPPADGLSIDADSDRAVIRGNVTQRNSDDGIDTAAPSTTLTANFASGNGDLGIKAVPGVIDGGGNRAFGNGNPLQCLNIVCR